MIDDRTILEISVSLMVGGAFIIVVAVIVFALMEIDKCEVVERQDAQTKEVSSSEER